MAEIMGVELNINQEYIKGSVENIVRAAIVDALGDSRKVVTASINSVINRKVDSDGKFTDRSFGGTPYLQWLAEDTIKRTVAECMKEVVQENTPYLKMELMKLLDQKEFAQNASAAFVDMMLKSASSNWRMPVKVSFEVKDD